MIEKEFYKLFEITPKHNDGCRLADNYWKKEELQKRYKNFDKYMNENCTEGASGMCYSDCPFCYDEIEYPEITGEIYLELICILNSTDTVVTKEEIKELKKEILGEMIVLYKTSPNEEVQTYLKNQVKGLFEKPEE